MPEELWTEVHDIVQEAGIKTIPKRNKCKKAKWLSEEALQITMIARRNIINFRYADDTTLKAESKEELMSHLRKVKGRVKKLA